MISFWRVLTIAVQNPSQISKVDCKIAYSFLYRAAKPRLPMTSFVLNSIVCILSFSPSNIGQIS